MRRLLYFVVIVWILRIGLIDAKCLSDKNGVITTTRKKYFHYKETNNFITIESSSRTTHNITSNILAIYLQEVMGYHDVKIILNPDSDPMDSNASIRRLTTDPSLRMKATTLINLEVWEDIAAESVNHYMIEEADMISDPGRFGLFVRHAKLEKESLTSKQELRPLVFSAKEWNHVVKEANYQYFIPSQCLNSSCATLLAAHEVEFVKTDINEKKWMVQVVWLADKLEQVVKSFSQSRPLLILSFSPGFVNVSDDWHYIEFPFCEVSSPYDNAPTCAYGPRRLSKLVSSQVKAKDGDYISFVVRRMYLARNTFITFLKTADSQPKKSHWRIACDWMNENPETIMGWYPGPFPNLKPPLYIFGVFPKDQDSTGIAHAARLAVETVNNNSRILSNYDLQLVDNRVEECNPKGVLNPFVDYVLSNGIRHLVGILGPPCSDSVEPLVNVAQHFDIVSISYSAEGSVVISKEEQSYFYRTVGENSQYIYVYLQLLKKLNWKRIAAITEDGQKYTEYLSHLHDLLKLNNLTFVTHRKFPRNRNNATMRTSLEDLRSNNARIIVADIDEAAARSVFCGAHESEMNAANGYVWFLPSWLSPDWYDTDKLRNTTNLGGIECTTSQMLEVLEGHFSLAQQFLAPNDTVTHENKTVAEWREGLQHVLHGPTVLQSHYATYAYDAVWTYALALHDLGQANESFLDDIHSNYTSIKFKDLIKKSNFTGTSGRIQFGTGSSRVTNVEIRQWIKGSYRVVATAVAVPQLNESAPTVQDYKLEFGPAAIVWLTDGSKIPDDGEEHCMIQGFADLINLDCIGAIIIANIIGFGVLCLAVGLIVFITKRKYDKKVEQMEMTEEYIRKIKRLDLTQDLDEWETPKENVVINRKLGQGAFGTVYGGEIYKGETEGWVGAAIKTLKIKSTTDEKLDFLSEAEVMKCFDHKNIVKLLGVCTREEPVYTVMEYMLYGDLKTYLLSRRHLLHSQVDETNEVSPKRLTSMALDIARGLSYLSSLKYVHRDIACRNCLLSSDRVAKLADFGLTRRMFESDYYKFSRRGMLPIRWMAPESLADGLFTPSSDVWAFGVVLFEIITFGSYPFQGLSNSQVVELVKAGNTVQLPSSGIKPALEALIKSCWNQNYKKRPSISSIVVFLANNPRVLVPCVDQPAAAFMDLEEDILETDNPLFQMDHIDEEIDISAEQPLLPPFSYPSPNPSPPQHEHESESEL